MNKHIIRNDSNLVTLNQVEAQQKNGQRRLRKHLKKQIVGASSISEMKRTVWKRRFWRLQQVVVHQFQDWIIKKRRHFFIYILLKHQGLDGISSPNFYLFFTLENFRTILVPHLPLPSLLLINLIITVLYSHNIRMVFELLHSISPYLSTVFLLLHHCSHIPPHCIPLFSYAPLISSCCTFLGLPHDLSIPLAS